MQRSLDRRNGPLYRQFAGIIRDQIASGTIPLGSTLPTEGELAERYAVSLITVRTGLRELENEGLIRKQSAKPAVVTAVKPLVRPGIDFHSFAAIVEATRDRRLEVRSYRRERSVEAAAAFGRPRTEWFYCLRALLCFGDRPASQITIHFPRQVGEQLRRADFDDIVVFRTVQRKLRMRLAGARITLKAELADARAAREMAYAEGSPLLVAEMLYYAEDGRPIEYSVARNRADMFSVTYEAPNDIG